MKAAQFFLFFLGLVLFPFSQARGYQRTIEAEDCSLEPGGFRIHQNIGSYSGEGYMIILWKAGQSHGRLQKKLECSLPPGRYRLSLLTFAEGAENANQVRLALNGAATTLSWPDRTVAAGQRHWLSGEVVTQQPGDLFSLEVLKAHERLILDTFRIESVLPSEGKVAPPGNLVENSSFEGLTADWFTPYQCGYALLPGYIDLTQAYHGQSSLRLPGPMSVLSRPYQVEAGQVYSLSLWAKTVQATEVSLALTGEMGWKSFLHRKFTLSPEQGWQRLVLTGEVPARLAELMIKIEVSGPVWLDAVQLERGQPTAYQPKNPVSLGFLWPEVGRVFLQGKNVTWQVLFSGQGETTVVFAYSVYDINDRLVQRKEERIALRQGFARKTIELPGDKSGIYRVRCTSPEKKELTYAVVPEYAEPDSVLGAYITLKEEPLAILSRMGIRWNNTLSCGGILGTWSLVEPEKGKFVWADEAVALAEKYGFKILANLHAYFPRWVLSREPPEEPFLKTGNQYFRLSDWENFVQKTVEHYRDRIRYWLVIDEPYHLFTAEEYARLLAATFRVIKKVDPTAKVFAHGGFSDGFLPAVVEKVGPDCFDGISDYCRRKEHAQLIGSLARRYNKSFWSVEYGGYASFFSETEPPDSIGSRDSTQRLLESAIRSLCWGPAEKYLRYDARYPGPYPSYQKYCTMFEYDGSLKAPAVAYSVLNKLLCGYQGQEEIEGDRRLKIFLFQKGEERLVACWSGSGRLYRLVLPERASSWKILDMMGNEVEKEVGQGKVSLLLGPRPVYFCHLKPEDIKVFSAAGLEELLSLTTACVPDEAGILALKVNLKNTLSETASGSLGFSREAQYLLRNPGQRQRFSLQPGQSFSFLFPLNFGQRDVVENKLLELELAGPGLDSYFRQRLSYAGSRKVSFPIEVDGDLKEWTPFLDWTDDRSLRLDRATVNQEKSVRLTGRCLPAWDEEYLYLTFQVSAPEASPEHQLRVYLQPEGRQGTAYQLVFRPFEKPAALYGSLAEKVVWAFKEGQGRNYNLEMKIPWKQVGVTGRAGSSLWFNAVLVQTEGNRLVAEKAWAADLVAGEEKLGLGQLYLIRE